MIKYIVALIPSLLCTTTAVGTAFALAETFPEPFIYLGFLSLEK